MRRGVGLNADKLRHCPEVLSALSMSPTSAEAAVDRIYDLIASLGMTRESEALRQALNPGRGATRLTARRDELARQREVSVDTVTRCEDRAIDQLAAILTNLASLRRHPEGLKFSVIHQGLLGIYQARRHERLVHDFRVQALQDHVPEFRYITVSGMTTISQVTGAHHEVEEEHDGSAMHHFHFEKPLRLSETARFTFHESSEHLPTEPPTEDFLHQRIHLPTNSLTVRAQFYGGSPQTAWWYNAIYDTRRRRTDHNKQHELTINQRGTCEKQFANLGGGFWSGIAWTWDV